MIKINGAPFSSDNFSNQYAVNSIEMKIVNGLSSSKQIFNYNSQDQLKFEIELRMRIIEASRELYKSKFDFRVFRKSFCNEDYWERTEEGGFLLKEGITPMAAINDIFINSQNYGNECATAMVIVYYRALANILPEKLFNELYSNIQLMNWNYIDKDLGIRNFDSQDDNLPGDCRYFKNPDVDPLTPEWQGENAIDLGDGTYYGHGIGIKSKEAMIEELNQNRKPDSNESAYLINTVTRLNYKYIYEQYNKTLVV